jgi:FkbM family methyltransferase
LTFHINSKFQKIWSRIGIPLIERRAHHGFVDETIQFIASARLQRIDAPAHDSWRFQGGKPARPDPRTTYSILRYLEAREEQINRTAALLADEMSRDTLKRLLAFRAVGPHHVNPPIEVNRTVAYYKRAKELMIAPSSNDLPPFEVEIFRVPFGSTTVDVECWLGSLVATFFERQYYLERDGVSISPRQGDIVIDAGACFGDTALAFATNVGSEGMVHSFEPMASQRAFYERNRERNPGLADVLRIYDYALDKVSDDVVHFSNGGAGARPVRDGGGIEVKTITIDDFVQRFSLARVDFIKMDIEGAESHALTGASDSIRRFRPRLAISAYHSLDDLVELASKISEIERSYRLYLVHHSMHSEETVLYGYVE